MTTDNFNTRKSVLPPESGQGQSHLSEVPCIDPTSPPEKIELHSKPAPPTPPTIAWRKLMLEQ